MEQSAAPQTPPRNPPDHQPKPEQPLPKPPGYGGDPTSQPRPTLQKPPAYRDHQFQPAPGPLRKAALPPSFRPRPKRRRRCCRVCCCTFCILFIVIFLFLVIAAAVFYLLYDPALPKFRLSSFRVPKLNVSNTNDGAYLDADTTARVEVRNRSGKMSWHFGQSKVEVSADDGNLSLGSSKVAGFVVEQQGLAQVKAATKVTKLALDDRLRRKLKGAVESKALTPTVEIRTKTSVGLQGWNSPSIAVTVVCGGVTMRRLENGDPPLCSITLLQW
ncbi:hypothetical protein DEO72_LG1g1182 [Vigna unguiculata]|uniref:Late embryogenesis abundant protein n=1 Tax=Vigna unguiculata TaxID=3917 RepID=A0A4D6KPI5_VIGUN|nr:hypothetical protein DEO72_LG1g1182 [Vigna unguiculata]